MPPPVHKTECAVCQLLIGERLTIDVDGVKAR